MWDVDLFHMGLFVDYYLSDTLRKFNSCPAGSASLAHIILDILIVAHRCAGQQKRHWTQPVDSPGRTQISVSMSLKHQGTAAKALCGVLLELPTTWLQVCRKTPSPPSCTGSSDSSRSLYYLSHGLKKLEDLAAHLLHGWLDSSL